MVLAGNQPFFCCGGKVLLRPEKKVPVFCLAGCAVVSLCNQFVLVLVKIDLIHFDNIICISSI